MCWGAADLKGSVSADEYPQDPCVNAAGEPAPFLKLLNAFSKLRSDPLALSWTLATNRSCSSLAIQKILSR
jgi:hypothetical protein